MKQPKKRGCKACKARRDAAKRRKTIADKLEIIVQQAHFAERKNPNAQLSHALRDWRIKKGIRVDVK